MVWGFLFVTIGLGAKMTGYSDYSLPHKIKLVFVGGVFLSEQSEFIHENSLGVCQNAADSLQKNLLKGFSEIDDCDIELVNLPFVGSYPRRFKKAYFPATSGVLFDKVKVNGLSFCNVSLIKYFSRMFSLSRFLFKNKGKLKDTILIVYSLHFPILFPIVLLKQFQSGVRVCAVIPDLPMFMSDNLGFLYDFIKKIESWIISLALKYVDFYVTLTKSMQPALSLPENSSVVIEGVASKESHSTSASSVFPRFIFYSGTLASRYGIKLLIDAFHSVLMPDVELWICGEGDSREYVETMAIRDSRIKYLGQLKREEVLSLQEKSLFLINPRTSDGEYTKYSFPSKILEYMTSGRPVVMYRLEGVPEEYYDYCYTPDGEGIEPLARLISELCSTDSELLSRKGLLAMKFVLEKKSPRKQVVKIIDLLRKKYHE